MKELSIEEKAKRYDEALEKAKMVLQERGNEPDGAALLSKLFPHLRESDDERIRKKIIQLVNDAIATSAPYKKEMLAWLEKQGRLISNTSIVSSNEESLIPDIDKPKFVVGAYVTDDGETYFLIIGYADSMYQLETVEGTSGRFPKEIVERKFRLWSIKDAKDGDVLVSSSGKPFIFKGFFDNDPMAYGGLVGDESFWPASNSNWTTVYCKPATKEQRDLLFQKIKEAGYEWDAEKKELIKIEQNPNKCMYSNDNYTDEDRKVLCNGCEEDCKLKQKPVEWSEEDEKMIRALVSMCDVWATSHQFYPKENKEMEALKTWLKSLKDRCILQPKQEWSEEDEKMLTNAIAACNQCYFPKTAKWLKSLRPQKKWKPTKMQLECLKEACGEHFDLDGLDPLYTLYEHLKAL